jgi:hypothetical protein
MGIFVDLRGVQWTNASGWKGGLINSQYRCGPKLATRDVRYGFLIGILAANTLRIAIPLIIARYGRIVLPYFSLH